MLLWFLSYPLSSTRIVLGRSGISRDTYRGKITSVLMQGGLCRDNGEENLLEAFQDDYESMEANCSGAVIRTAAGSLHEREYAGDDEIPTIPPQEIVNCKFDPGPVGETRCNVYFRS